MCVDEVVVVEFILQLMRPAYCDVFDANTKDGVHDAHARDERQRHEYESVGSCFVVGNANASVLFTRHGQTEKIVRK